MKGKNFLYQNLIKIEFNLDFNNFERQVYLKIFLIIKQNSKESMLKECYLSIKLFSSISALPFNNRDFKI